MLKNVAGQDIGAQMLTASDGTAFTSTVTVYVTIEGGTQTLGTVGSGVCTHEGNGYHSYLPSQAETNGDHIAYTFIGTLAAPSTLQVYPDAVYDRLGAPAGASVSADIAAIEGQTDDIGVAGAGLTAVPYNSAWDTSINAQVDAAIETYHLHTLLHTTYNSASPPGVTDSLLNEMTENNAGTTRFTAATLATGPGGTPSQPLLHSTTILAYTSNVDFTLADGSADDDAYNNQMIVITDQSTGTQKAVGHIKDTGGYIGSSRTIALTEDPGVFTFANNDVVEIWAVTGSSIGVDVDTGGRVNLGKVFDVTQTPGDLAAQNTAIDTIVNDIEADLANGVDGLGALSTDIATAQADLNTITGADGVTLATAQGLYAPATAAALATTDGKVDTIDTVVDGIQTDLDNATDGLGALKADLASIITGTITNATGIDVATDVVALKVVADAIQTITDQFNFTVAGDVDANVQAIANAAISEGGSDPASPIGQT